MAGRHLCAVLLLLPVFQPADAHAQQTAVRHYTVDNGLGNDTVGSAFQDRHGFIWFATAEGLSRFDGYRFVTYTKADGLADNVVHRVDESPDGTVWVATSGGLARLLETPGRGAFASTPVGHSRGVRAFGIAGDGAIWCMQDDGAYRAMAGATLTFSRVAPLPVPAVRPRAFRDRTGRLWLSRDARLFHADGAALVPHDREGQDEPIRGIAERADGTLLIARTSGLWSLAPAASTRPDRWQLVASGLADLQIRALAVDSRDRIWIGSAKGLVRLDPARGLTAVKSIQHDVVGILADRDGNIWVTTAHEGVFRVASEPVVSYTTRDGLDGSAVLAIVEGDGGKVYAVTQRGGTFELGDDGAVRVPGSHLNPFTSVRRRIVFDGRGWWMWTDDGLYHIDGTLDFRRARRVGPAGPPFRPDADGPSLVAAEKGAALIGTPAGLLFRAAGTDPGTLTELTSTATMPPSGPLARTRGGSVWIGAHTQLGRLANGRYRRVLPVDAAEDLYVISLFVDSRGWLWAGSFNRGVAVTRDPEAPQPVFAFYSEASGLASAFVASIAEDRHGRMYFATGRGLDRLDPATGRVRHFTTNDGLVSAKNTYCFRDSRGWLWIATTAGVSRLIPADERDYTPPAVRLLTLRAGGRDVAVPPRGTAQAVPLQMEPSQASLQVEYVAVNHRGENTLRYQFRLDGSDQAWSAPTDSRTVIFGNLAAGSYRLRVRAISAEGRIGPDTAALAVTVLPPIWKRWWFVMMIALAAAAAAFSLYRMRMNHLLAVERIRRQVALDLHDDVGAGLVQIAVMGELAAADPRTGERMWPDVAAVARSLRDSMSDIVWAVDPNRDSLADLVQRLQDVAYAVLEADGLAVDFSAPSAAEMSRIEMPTDRRRHVLLVLKEAIANIVRHAEATHVRIRLRLQPRALELLIEDDGRGFDSLAVAGNGLRSMRERAAQAGGTLRLRSSPGQGTAIALIVPA